jgi:hypothetical protein
VSLTAPGFQPSHEKLTQSFAFSVDLIAMAPTFDGLPHGSVHQDVNTLNFPVFVAFSLSSHVTPPIGGNLSERRLRFKLLDVRGGETYYLSHETYIGEDTMHAHTPHLDQSSFNLIRDWAGMALRLSRAASSSGAVCPKLFFNHEPDGFGTVINAARPAPSVDLILQPLAHHDRHPLVFPFACHGLCLHPWVLKYMPLRRQLGKRVNWHNRHINSIDGEFGWSYGATGTTKPTGPASMTVIQQTSLNLINSWLALALKFEASSPAPDALVLNLIQQARDEAIYLATLTTTQRGEAR